MDRRDIMIGAAAGLFANLFVALVDRALATETTAGFVSAHQVAGRELALTALGRAPTPRQEHAGRLAFVLLYGAGWGILYALARRRLPALGRAGGLPFAVPFFLACDGVIAPRLGLAEPLGARPWQPNAKELANHVAWTAAAEAVHRAAGRA